jgi:hypothetical protein
MISLTAAVQPLSAVDPAATAAAPHLVVDQLDELGDLAVADVVTLALLVGDGAGVLVVCGGRPSGFLPWEALADALPELASSVMPSRGLYGIPDSPARCYVCRRCDPPLRRLPRSGYGPPDCPADLLHGQMEREVV